MYYGVATIDRVQDRVISVSDSVWLSRLVAGGSRLRLRQRVTLRLLPAIKVWHRASGLIAVLEVVSDRLSIFPVAVAQQLLHRLPDAPVQLVQLAPQKALVGHLLRQGVLEQVLQVRVHVALADQVGGLQRR